MFQRKDKESVKRQRELLTLLKELEFIQKEMDVSDANYREADNSDILDAIIYERAAARARYSYLLKEIRKYEEEKAKKDLTSRT